ncbi:MAG: hypothetical protein LBD25_05055 [Coriobacteriales bacterium]|jgi:hypothetical protein|nr:hypothetical protein [Coriobacteriales bacterium]
MTACWELRGCDDEMAQVCPHATSSTDGRCVADCCYTFCQRPLHKVATDFGLLLDATVDRRVAVKESCTFCEHFLLAAPRLDAAGAPVGRLGTVGPVGQVGPLTAFGAQSNSTFGR